MISMDDAMLVGYTVHFDIRVSKDESVLANSTLARLLIQAALLPIDWENRKNRTVIEIFSSFYLMMLEVSFISHFFL